MPGPPHDSRGIVEGLVNEVVQGMSNKTIARELELGEGTVKVHMAALFRTLGVRTRSAAAVAGSLLSPSGP